MLPYLFVIATRKQVKPRAGNAALPHKLLSDLHPFWRRVCMRQGAMCRFTRGDAGMCDRMVIRRCLSSDFQLLGYKADRIMAFGMDTDARWTKKHGKSHYGYKTRVNVDRQHKLVRCYHVSDAALHDSQTVDHLLMEGNTGAGVWADPAYRSEKMEAKLRDRKLRSRIHCKGKRGKPLSEQGKSSNRTKSAVRARVKHIFGAQTNDMGGTLVRTIGIVRAKSKIGMKNLAYNMRRLAQLCRLIPCPA